MPHITATLSFPGEIGADLRTSPEPDARRLDRLLDGMAVTDMLWLSERLEPPWRVRQRRHAARDEAIRQAMVVIGGLPTAAASALAIELRRCRDERGVRNPALLNLLQTILAMNGARDPPAWRRLYDIATERKTS